MKSSNLAEDIKNNFLFFAIIILFLALLIRNFGLYPGVFQDEYLYSKFSRLLPLAESTIPGYIYLAIYRFTNICGDGFLDCARMLNVLFFVAAAPFIYLTARQVSPKSVASIVALLALLGPINSYTAYYMPESFYFFSFWLFTWFILRLDNTSDLKSWCFAGMLLGLSALVKPHALFVLPAITAYILYVSRKKEDKWLLRAFWNTCIFVIVTFFTKLLFGYLLAGKAGLTILGHFYTSIASPTTSIFQYYINLIAASGVSVKGHVLAICLMYGLPVACAIFTSVKSVGFKVEVKADQKIAFYALVILANLVLVTALFTASIANSGGYSTITSLHMRYYNFILPILLVVAASQLSLKSITSMRKWRVIVALPVGAGLLYAVYTHLTPYTSNFIDSPEISGFIFDHSTAFYVLSGISFFSLLLWTYMPQIGARVFVYLAMPIAVVISTFHVNPLLSHKISQSNFCGETTC
jgi:phosphoglycerol transferase